jgi:hypothetical protein
MSDVTSDTTFTLMDVFGDALQRARAAWATHLAFGIVFVALVLLSCCGSSCIVVPFVAFADPGATGDEPPLAAMIAIYAVFAVVSVFLGALHEAVTLHVSFATDRGEDASLRRALEASVRRWPSLTGTVLLRTLTDVGLPVAAGTVLAVVSAAAGGGASEGARVLIALTMTLVYFTSLGWALLTRAHFGLAMCCAVREELGPRAAFARSHALLRGRRWHFLAFRLAYFVAGFALYCFSFAPFFAFALSMPQRAVGGDPADPMVLWVFPLLFLVYAVLLALYTFDSILLAAYHARSWRPLDAEAVARVFE